MKYSGALTGAIALMQPGVVLAQSDTFRYAPGPHMMWNGGWYGMVFGPLFMILILIAVVAFAVILIRWLGVPALHPQHPVSTESEPLDILKERFARGDIDKDEFEERRRVLDA